MIKILLNKAAEDFVTRRELHRSEPESNDGMRRGYSYTARTQVAFSFGNEQKEEEGYSYDLRVVQRDECSTGAGRELTADRMKFLENFGYISEMLRRRGLSMLDHPAYVIAEARLRAGKDEDTVELCFESYLSAVHGDEGRIWTLPALLAYLSEQDEHREEMRLARALGDRTPFGTKFHVSVDSVPEGLLGRRDSLATLEKISLKELFATGEANKDRVRQALMSFVKRVEKHGSYVPLETNGLEEIIAGLRGEQAAAVLRRCRQTSENLDLFRKYCSDRIDWRQVILRDMRESDLDLMIECKMHAHTDDQWAFLQQCMARPELERKIVENAGTLAYYDFTRFARMLRTVPKVELFRSICGYFHADERIDYRIVEQLPQLGNEGLSRPDYDLYRTISQRTQIRYMSDVNQIAVQLLTLGVAAKVPSDELAKTLQEECITGDHRAELLDGELRRAYRELNFAPGLAWIEAEEERKAAEERRRAEEQERSNQEVVEFVQRSGKNAVRVCCSKSYNPEGVRICTPDEERIGVLMDGEQRVLLLEGRGFSYLVDVQRARKAHNGVLHLDVLSDDAGYIIGPKGSKIKATTESLRKLGCPVRLIKLHTHEESEGVI